MAKCTNPLCTHTLPEHRWNGEVHRCQICNCGKFCTVKLTFKDAKYWIDRGFEIDLDIVKPQTQVGVAEYQNSKKLEVNMKKIDQRPVRRFAKETTDEIENKCRHCADGWQPDFLDDDGVKVSISGNSGKLSHAYDDYFWECPNACSCSQNVHGIRCCGISVCEFVAGFCIHCGKPKNKCAFNHTDCVDCANCVHCGREWQKANLKSDSVETPQKTRL